VALQLGRAEPELTERLRQEAPGVVASQNER
jgi:hypothetical protein